MNSAIEKSQSSPDSSIPSTQYQGRNALFHKSAFVTSDAFSDVRQQFGLAGIIADGTKSGVLSAFREMMATREAVNGNAAGFTKASYETGGDDNPAVAAGRRIGRAERASRGDFGGDLPDVGASNQSLGHPGVVMLGVPVTTLAGSLLTRPETWYVTRTVDTLAPYILVAGLAVIVKGRR